MGAGERAAERLRRQALASGTDRVRIRSICLAPGEQLGCRHHVLDDFWTAVTDGRASSDHDDGWFDETVCWEGDTRHLSFGIREGKIYDLANAETADSIFTAVEVMDGADPSLPPLGACSR